MKSSSGVDIAYGKNRLILLLLLEHFQWEIFEVEVPYEQKAARLYLPYFPINFIGGGFILTFERLND